MRRARHGHLGPVPWRRFDGTDTARCRVSDPEIERASGICAPLIALDAAGSDQIDKVADELADLRRFKSCWRVAIAAASSEISLLGCLVMSHADCFGDGTVPAVRLELFVIDALRQRDGVRLAGVVRRSCSQRLTCFFVPA